MANLQLIKTLNRRYQKNSPLMDQRGATNEAFDPDRIQKAFSFSISELGRSYQLHFDLGLSAEVALLFIDVCDFSTRCGSLNGKQISQYFDEYYDLIIPIIYRHGGEIDKVIGDGIVCVFGAPFLDGNKVDLIDVSHKCAQEIIIKTEDTKFSSKVAYHIGEINYFRNKTGYYDEFTIVGRPMTELFRLESASRDECINYFVDTPIDAFFRRRINAGIGGNWDHQKESITGLQGVTYRQFIHARRIR